MLLSHNLFPLAHHYCNAYLLQNCIQVIRRYIREVMSNMEASKKHEKKHWYDLIIFGYKIHPGFGIAFGVLTAILQIGGLIGAFGAIILLASIIALFAKERDSKKK